MSNMLDQDGSRFDTSSRVPTHLNEDPIDLSLWLNPWVLGGSVEASEPTPDTQHCQQEAETAASATQSCTEQHIPANTDAQAPISAPVWENNTPLHNMDANSDMSAPQLTMYTGTHLHFVQSGPMNLNIMAQNGNTAMGWNITQSHVPLFNGTAQELTSLNRPAYQRNFAQADLANLVPEQALPGPPPAVTPPHTPTKAAPRESTNPIRKRREQKNWSQNILRARAAWLKQNGYRKPDGSDYHLSSELKDMFQTLEADPGVGPTIPAHLHVTEEEARKKSRGKGAPAATHCTS